MRRKHSAVKLKRPDDYARVVSEVIELLETSRRSAARVVNVVITSTYWEIGRRIVESEMRGARRAGYGEGLIDRLATDLTRRFGRGFSRRAVYQMRAFYLAYPAIVQSAIAQSTLREGRGKVQSLEGLPNKILAARYKTALPEENTLVAELEKTRKLLESRSRARHRPD